MSITVIVPESASIAELEAMLVGFDPAWNEVDRILYTLGMLVEGMYTNRTNANENGFVPLSSAVLSGKMSSYRNNLKKLIFLGIIEVKDSYKVGKHSKGYRLSKQHQTRLIPQILHTDRDLVMMHYNKLDHAKLASSAPNSMRDSFNSKLGFHESKVERVLNDAVKDKENWLRYLAMQRSYFEIINQEFKIQRDNTVGRVHSTITLMPKKLRNHLTFDSKKLFKIDVRACHPFILAAMASGELVLDEKLKDRLQQSNLHITTVNSILNDLTHLLTPITTNLVSKRKSECKTMVQQIRNGQFYSQFAEDESEEAVKRAKRNLLTSWNLLTNKSEMMESFKSKFPLLCDYIVDLKTPNYKDISNLLMKIESYLMIDVIYKELLTHHKVFPLYTIHDCVMTTEEHVDTVSRIMKEVFSRYLGEVPELKID